jgi:cytidine deaminase
LETNLELHNLLAAAKGVLSNAYAPYSGFRVAAAVRDEKGQVFTGVNVENTSFGLTICAERSAVFAAITNGAKGISAIAIVSEKQNTIRPCGACRQVIAEFAGNTVPVVTENEVGEITAVSVGELLPMAFRGPMKSK